MPYWYPRYVSVAEKKAKVQKKLDRLKKKNPNILPVILTGNALASTWWGKSWNRNLERYADYENRIGRGRSYIRHGAVLDLKIEPGRVTALVLGSQAQPYDITVQIRPIDKKTWAKIKHACQGRIDSLPELLEGKFPKALEDLFTARGEGLFPSSEEIKFDCSCPDWASMCKHVAAALYGIGARLDEDPLLFFTLRNADVNELITEAVEDHTQSLLEKAGNKSDRALAETDLGEMFGIELETDNPGFANAPTERETDLGSDREKQPRAGTRKNPKGKASVKKTKKVADPKTRPPKKTKAVIKAKSSLKGKGRAGNTKTAKTASGKKSLMTGTDIVEDLIRRSRKGTNIATLEKKTGIDFKKLSEILDHLKKHGKVETLKKGMYTKVR